MAKSIRMDFSQIAFPNFQSQGMHGVEDEVFLSLPCVLGQNGVYDVIRQPLTDTEAAQLRKSAELMGQVQEGIKF